VIKAVVFDVGGVLCHWEGVVKEFAAETKLAYSDFYNLFLQLSFNPDTGSDLGLISMDEFFKRLAITAGAPDKAADWRQRFVQGFTRTEPTYRLLDELKGKYCLAALTNAKIGLWDEWKEGNLRQYFKIIVDSAEVHVLKPDEKIYRILLEKLQLPARECLFIDDFIENVEAAQKLGFVTVHFTEPETGVAEIKKILDLS